MARSHTDGLGAERLSHSSSSSSSRYSSIQLRGGRSTQHAVAARVATLSALGDRGVHGSFWGEVEAGGVPRMDQGGARHRAVVGRRLAFPARFDAGDDGPQLAAVFSPRRSGEAIGRTPAILPPEAVDRCAPAPPPHHHTTPHHTTPHRLTHTL